MQPTPAPTSDILATDAAAGDIGRTERVLREGALPAPEEWQVVDIRAERHNEQCVTVTRYKPHQVRDLGGEHITVVVDEQDTLLGYTRMSVATADRPLPEPDTAQRVALDSLHRTPSSARDRVRRWRMS